MDKKGSKTQLGKFLKAEKALAIPVSYLILFVSLIAIISATYSFAIVRINARGALLKASVAKQDIRILDEGVRSVAWSFGASEVVYMDDGGGVFRVKPAMTSLMLNVTDGQSFYDVVFNSSVGRASYELEPSEFSERGLYISGDGRAIVNQSASTVTQLYVTTEDNAEVIVLSYRPLATVATVGNSGGKPLNLIRVYVTNLNSSQSLVLREDFYLKITSINVSTVARQYEFNQSVSSLAVQSVLDGTSTTVWLPVSSSVNGAIVNLEIAVCNVKVERVVL